MKKLKKNQTGSAVIILVVILVLAIVGLTGWYVWHSKQVADKTLNQANAVSQSAAISPKYLVVNGWSDRFKLPADLPDVTTTPPLVKGIVPDEINLSSKIMTNEAHNEPKCASAGSENIFLNRYKVGDENPGDAYLSFSTQGGPTLTQSDLDNAIKIYGAHVGDYYFVPRPGHFCSDTPSELKANTAAQKVAHYQLEIDKAISTMQAIK